METAVITNILSAILLPVPEAGGLDEGWVATLVLYIEPILVVLAVTVAVETM